jgi:hypothetical protein
VLTRLADVESAEWIVAAVRGHRGEVASLVPAVFPAYARVLHPAGLDPDREVRWADVAAANGRVAHRAMEWTAITGGWRHQHRETQPGLWDAPPSTGSLPVRPARALAAVLSRFTRTPQDCRFAVWIGSGAAAFDPGAAPLVELPGRPMALFGGPASAITTNLDRPPFDQRAHLWWPADRAWCVAGDVDLTSTYLGGSAAAVSAVLADPTMETYAVPPGQRITWEADTVNPNPPPR